MTKIEFVLICNKYLIDPDLALENDDIIKAIKNKDMNNLIDVLENQF